VNRERKSLLWVLGVCFLLGFGGRFFVSPEQQRGWWLAVAAVLPLHFVLTRRLLRFSRKDPARLWAWGLGSLLRLGALGGVAVVIGVRGDIDPLAALLSFAGLMGGSMGVQSWVLSNEDAVTLNGSERT